MNISKGGVLFETDQLPVPGVEIDLRIAWARMGGPVGLTLIIGGRVLRVQQNLCAVAITRSSFQVVPLSMVPGSGHSRS